MIPSLPNFLSRKVKPVKIKVLKHTDVGLVFVSDGKFTGMAWVDRLSLADGSVFYVRWDKRLADLANDPLLERLKNLRKQCEPLHIDIEDLERRKARGLE